MYAPLPIPLGNVSRQLPGLYDGEWFAQFEPPRRALWVPAAESCYQIAGELPPAAFLHRLARVPFPLELGIVRDAFRVLDVSLPGTFQDRIQALADYEWHQGLEPLEAVFRFVHSIEDINRALAGMRKLYGAGALLLKRWDASYPLSSAAPVEWMSAVRVSKPIASPS